MLSKFTLFKKQPEVLVTEVTDKVYNPSVSTKGDEILREKRNRYLKDNHLPTRRLWTIISLAMFIPLFVLGATLLALSRKAHAAPASSATSSGSTSSALGPVVDLGYSQYQGIQGAAGPDINAWLGMRYAAPPVGDLRFRAPQPPATTNTLQPANKHGAWCLPSPSTGPTNGANEDCLFVDVMAPANTTVKHPVFVYIQGGGMNVDASPNMNGSHIIKNGDNDIVVVTFNYRVGAFGFLASKEVKANGDINVGNLDQRFVLHWVQDHIDKFGGDPKRVTLGGASAGAASVNLQLVAYGGRDDGLFHQATGESNSFGAQQTVEESQYQFDNLVKNLGCNSTSDTLACLRKFDVNTFIAHNSILPTPGATGDPVYMWSNVIDGNFTQDYTYNALAQGKFVKVPTIFGSDTNEGTIFTPSDINTIDDVNAFLKNQWVKLTTAQLTNLTANGTGYYQKSGQYPGKGAYWKTAATAYGQMRYNCPGVTLSNTFAATSAKTWHYHWDVVAPGNDANGLGVTHTAESPSIWGESTGVEALQIPIISGYWASFIRTGDPNTQKVAAAPAWDAWGTGGGEQRMVHFVNDQTQDGMETMPQAQLDLCAWLAGIGPSIAQ